MHARIDLRKLAEREGPERAYVSLYITGPDSLNSLSRRVENVRNMLSDQPHELEHFDNSIEMVRTYLDNNPPDGPLCVFASWAEDYFQVFELAQPAEDLLWIDSSPYIRPLAELQDEYENFVIVSVDNERASIYYVTSAQMKEEERVSGNVKSSSKKGGWSQKRYERRRDKQLHRYVKDVAERLQALAEEKPFRRLVLIGSGETLGAVRDALSQDLRNRLVGVEATNAQEEPRIWNEAYKVYLQEEREEEEDLWSQIKGEYMRDGRAEVGPVKVLKAARVGRMAHLLVNREAKLAGTRCRDCEMLHAGKLNSCKTCGSRDVFTVDLINELVELAERTDAPVEFSEPLSGLQKVGDVAALLRY